MAYLQIVSDSGRLLGEIRIIDGRNVVFDTKGNKIGYWQNLVFYDLAGNTFNCEEDLFLRGNK